MIRNSSGQALLETMMTLPFLLIFSIGTIDILHLATVKAVMHVAAAQAALRVSALETSWAARGWFRESRTSASDLAPEAESRLERMMNHVLAESLPHLAQGGAEPVLRGYIQRDVHGVGKGIRVQLNVCVPLLLSPSRTLLARLMAQDEIGRDCLGQFSGMTSVRPGLRVRAAAFCPRLLITDVFSRRVP